MNLLAINIASQRQVTEATIMAQEKESGRNRQGTTRQYQPDTHDY